MFPLLEICGSPWEYVLPISTTCSIVNICACFSLNSAPLVVAWVWLVALKCGAQSSSELWPIITHLQYLWISVDLRKIWLTHIRLFFICLTIFRLREILLIHISCIFYVATILSSFYHFLFNIFYQLIMKTDFKMVSGPIWFLMWEIRKCMVFVM